MGIRDYFRRRQVDTKNCGACGAVLPGGANYCSNCGVRLDEPEAQPLHIVDRATGLFNDRFIRPVLEDELARAHRYGRPLGIVLVENVSNGDGPHPPEALQQQEETLKLMAATRVLESVNTALSANGRRAALGIVCVHHGQRLRAGAVIEAASRSLRSGRPELLGR